MEKLLFFLFITFCSCQLTAQFKHYDFIGAGHDNEITITTSSASNAAKGDKTVDGFPIQNEEQLKDAFPIFSTSNLLELTCRLFKWPAAMGYEDWLDEQFNLPQITTTNEMYPA